MAGTPSLLSGRSSAGRFAARPGWSRIGLPLLVVAAFLAAAQAAVPAVAAASTGPRSSPARAVGRSAGGASSVEAAAEKAMKAAGGVHVVLVATEKSEKPESVVGDLGTSSGKEVLTYGKAEVHVLLTPTSAYFSGNTSGLTTFFGLSSSVVKKIGSRWISLAKNTSQYAGFKNQASLAGFASTVFPAKGAKSLRLVRTTKAGKKVDVLSWTETASGSSTELDEKLTLPATGKPLPLSEDGTAEKGSSTARLTFTRWGEHVSVAVPGSSVAYSKVSG